MKSVTFISQKETLKETLSSLVPKFDTLLSLVPKTLQQSLGPVDLAFCDNSFVTLNEYTFNLQLDEPPKTIEGLLEETVRELLHRGKFPYVQCLGQQYKDFRLQMKNLNFGRTIMETSPTFKTLFSVLPYNYFFQLLLNYIIIVPYKGQFYQIAGRPLNERFNMKAVGGNSGGYRRQKMNNNFVVAEPINQQGPISPNLSRSNSLPRVAPKQGVAQNIKQNEPVSSTQPANTPVPPSSINVNQPKKNIGLITKSYSYSTDHIHRMQIFYCSAMNRFPGLFAKNLFFDKGQKKSIFINEIGHLIKDCIDENFRKKMNIPEAIINNITPIIKQFFENVRDMFNICPNNGKNFSKFAYLLYKICPLPADYHTLKKRVRDFTNKKQKRLEDGSQLFDDLYAAASCYEQVTTLMRQCIKRTVPQGLIGVQNTKILINMMDQFVTMKRFENFKTEDFLSKMNVFELKWLQIKYNKKYYRKIVTRARKYLAMVIVMLINDFVVPILKLNFYVTQKHKEANRIFYYRKPLWTLVSKVALTKFSQQNLQSISGHMVVKIKKDIEGTYPEGKLRILPKKGTFRPIITFNRKVKFYSDINPNQPLKATLNQILGDTQLVLRNLKHVLGQKFGYCIFDNRQIMRKYDAFVMKWRDMGCPPLKYFTLDIKKCYDSIDTSMLLRFIQETNYIQDLYMILKYNRLYRNKKPLLGKTGFTNLFNYKERVTAVGLNQDPIEIREDHKIPAINIFPAKQKLITKQAIINKLKCICEGSIISYRKNYWLQKLGIPQGLNVSGVLCSLYFAYLQQQYVKVKNGLLMRLTDDFFYIGPQNEAKQVLDSLILCSKKSGFKFSQDKISKNFEHPIMKKMSSATQIIWIGKKINVQTLEMIPNFEMSDKITYAMNVNINRGNIKAFLKNKLKSLLTNHFASYFKPKLFQFASLAKVVRLYTEISLQKFLPFIVKVLETVNKPQQLLIKVLKSAIHEFLLYACMLADSNNQTNSSLYPKLYVEVGEEISAFFGRRMHNQQMFINLRKIFEFDCLRMKSRVQKNSKMQIQTPSS